MLKKLLKLFGLGPTVNKGLSIFVKADKYLAEVEADLHAGIELAEQMLARATAKKDAHTADKDKAATAREKLKDFLP
jgi:hypothetical protein